MNSTLWKHKHQDPVMLAYHSTKTGNGGKLLAWLSPKAFSCTLSQYIGGKKTLSHTDSDGGAM